MQKNISVLTGLRGVAAIWVAAYHSFNYFFIFVLFAPLYPHIPFFIGVNKHGPAIITHGFYGVDLFFMLSGFVIAYTYWDRFKEKGLTFYRPYLVARFARIYPAYITVVLLGSLVVAMHWNWMPAAMRTWVNFIHSFPLMLFLFHDLFYRTIGTNIGAFWWYNAPLWSASIEWTAYLFVPFIFVLLRRFKGATMIALGVLFIVLLQLIVLYASPDFAGKPTKMIAYFFFGFPGLIRYGCEFMVGVAACFLYHKLYGANGVRADLISIVLFAMLVLCMYYFPYVSPFLLLMGLFFVFSAHSSGIVKKILGSKFMVGLGKVSYCLYLTHYIVLHVFIQYFLTHKTYLLMAHSDLLRVMLYVLFWVCAFVIAALLYLFVEKPFRVRIRAWLLPLSSPSKR